MVHLNIIRIAIIAVLNKKRDTLIIAVGGIASLLFFVLFLRMGAFYNNYFLLSLTNLRIAYYFLFIFSIPIAANIYLGLEFAFINKTLKQKLDENEKLSEEKQHILGTQNETLEKQVTERTAELEHKNRDLEIEAALARVRAKALSMTSSNELQDMISLVFQQIKNLGIELDNAQIHLYKESSKDMSFG